MPVSVDNHAENKIETYEPEENLNLTKEEKEHGKNI